MRDSLTALNGLGFVVQDGIPKANLVNILELRLEVFLLATKL